MKKQNWIIIAFALIATQQWVGAQFGGMGGIPGMGMGGMGGGMGGMGMGGGMQMGGMGMGGGMQMGGMGRPNNNGTNPPGGIGGTRPPGGIGGTRPPGGIGGTRPPGGIGSGPQQGGTNIVRVIQPNNGYARGVASYGVNSISIIGRNPRTITPRIMVHDYSKRGARVMLRGYRVVVLSGGTAPGGGAPQINPTTGLPIGPGGGTTRPGGQMPMGGMGMGGMGMGGMGMGGMGMGGMPMGGMMMGGMMMGGRAPGGGQPPGRNRPAPVPQR